MNKKILIASLFATLMLLVPMTSVVGVYDVENDCGCEVISSRNLVRAERLLARLEVYINIILLRFGHIPEVAEKCQEILDVINSNRVLDYPILCAEIERLFNKLIDISSILEHYFNEFKNNPIIVNIIGTFLVIFIRLSGYVWAIGVIFDCWGPEP